jgi:hypothetical protein
VPETRKLGTGYLVSNSTANASTRETFRLSRSLPPQFAPQFARSLPAVCPEARRRGLASAWLTDAGCPGNAVDNSLIFVRSPDLPRDPLWWSLSLSS